MTIAAHASLCWPSKPPRLDLRVLGYCLMTNHVHLVVVPEREESLATPVGDAATGAKTATVPSFPSFRNSSRWRKCAR